MLLRVFQPLLSRRLPTFARKLVFLSSVILILPLFSAAAQEATPGALEQSPSAQQQAAPGQEQPTQAAAVPAAAPAKAGKPQTQPPSPSEAPEADGVSEEELRRMLVGKALYLRGGYLENLLSFDEHGREIGRSPRGSYTLSAIEIDRVRLTKHKVLLEGARYGLHFIGQLAYEDPATAVDRVRITPKKKLVKISIDREIVVKAKKDKEAEKGKKGRSGGLKGIKAALEQSEASETQQLKASIAATPEEERPADAGSVTTTASAAHAARVLRDALDAIFAQGLDERMMGAMPEFWRLYYQAVEAKADYRPADPAILRQNTVDRKARLASTFEPESNEFAQANGVAGMALYHTVVQADGTAGEIAVGRPIGFGLDENAVAAIRAAKFEPAMKDGKPVPVLLDLLVQFRIFSKRTAAPGQAASAEERDRATVLPGPYSLNQR